MVVAGVETISQTADKVEAIFLGTATNQYTEAAVEASHLTAATLQAAAEEVVEEPEVQPMTELEMITTLLIQNLMMLPLLEEVVQL